MDKGDTLLQICLPVRSGKLQGCHARMHELWSSRADAYISFEVLLRACSSLQGFWNTCAGFSLTLP